LRENRLTSETAVVFRSRRSMSVAMMSAICSSHQLLEKHATQKTMQMRRRTTMITANAGVMLQFGTQIV